MPAIHVESLYGYHSGEALVQITLPDGQSSCQLGVTEALQFARQVIGAATAAETDYLLVRFLTVKVGMPIEQIAAVLADMRAMRKEP